MKQDIVLSINPLYRCNFRCSFCYLTKEQLSDKSALDLNELKSRLDELKLFRKISHIDLYGGEISLLEDDYVDDLLKIIREHYQGPINLITNLSRVSKICHLPGIDLSVSWDAELRQDHSKVLSNIVSLDRDIHLLMLASPEMLAWSEDKIDQIINVLNSVTNIVSVEIKPYSSNQANDHKTTYHEFELFIIKWLKRKSKIKFSFTNEKLINQSLEKTRNAWSDDHLYITPAGKFAVLEFDKNSNEYFLSLEKLDDYISWCEQEKARIHKNLRCRNCEYLGSCLSEHLKDHIVENDSCDGFKGLLDWYKANQIQIGEPHGSCR